MTKPSSPTPVVDAELLTRADDLLEPAAPLCPVDRLPTRRRNKICIAIIAFGLLNFVVYTLSYAILGGDAHNGQRRIVETDSGARVAEYTVRGHFLRSLHGQERVVSRTVWIYSYLHSIFVPVTSAAMIISMLVLARPHIIATMRNGWISGQTFVTAFGTVVILVSAAVTLAFIADFVGQMSLQ